jgi:hypothetical protein
MPVRVIVQSVSAGFLGANWYGVTRVCDTPQSLWGSRRGEPGLLDRRHTSFGEARVAGRATSVRTRGRAATTPADAATTVDVVVDVAIDTDRRRCRRRGRARRGGRDRRPHHDAAPRHPPLGVDAHHHDHRRLGPTGREVLVAFLGCIIDVPANGEGGDPCSARWCSVPTAQRGQRVAGLRRTNDMRGHTCLRS